MPEWYKLTNLDFSIFRKIDCVARDVRTRQKESVEIRPEAISNDVADVHTSISLFCTLAAAKGSRLLAVTRSFGAGSPRGTGYYIWLTPLFAHNCEGAQVAIAHELAHAYVGSHHQHDKVWENLYIKILSRLNREHKSPTIVSEIALTHNGKHRS